MGKILEKLMKKYWKNAKNTGKVDEKILEKCKKNWKSQGNSSVQKSGNHGLFQCPNISVIFGDPKNSLAKKQDKHFPNGVLFFWKCKF